MMRTLSARPWPTTFVVTVVPLQGVAQADGLAIAQHQDVVEGELVAGFGLSFSTRSVSPFTRYPLYRP